MGVASISRTSSTPKSTAKDSFVTRTAPPTIIIAPPLGLDNQFSYFPSSDRESKQKSVVLRVFDVLKGIRPGSDLTSFQVPSQFNLPKSQLQLYAEQVYCCGQNLLDQCADGATPMDRFLAVIRWHISLTRPAPFAKSPYNPILGETHHVTAGDLNVLTEQVSHHPPISVLYGTNSTKKIEVFQWSSPVPSFRGGSVEVSLGGKRTLTLADHGEAYEMTPPRLSIRFLPISCSEWTGDTIVRCVETGLEAKVSFKPRSILAWGKDTSNRVSGKIWKTSSKSEEPVYTLAGRWDETITLQDKRTGEKKLFFDGKAVLTNLKAPAITSQAIPATESLVVWSKVTEGVWKEDWEAARNAKTSIEEKQRELRRERSKMGVTWKPQFFNETPHGDWEWSSKGKPVPQAVIVQ